MSETYISAALRRLVAHRANYCCEYCLIHEEDTFFGCHVDHIISEKHGGQTNAENLGYACGFCNLHKGSDLGSLTVNGELCRFFNPRRDNWNTHFLLEEAFIQSLTDVGEVTARILQFNHVDRLLEREALIAASRYPP
jgi:5-methylcytosine-specific restriction endonuclease McrA